MDTNVTSIRLFITFFKVVDINNTELLKFCKETTKYFIMWSFYTRRRFETVEWYLMLAMSVFTNVRLRKYTED